MVMCSEHELNDKYWNECRSMNLFFATKRTLANVLIQTCAQFSVSTARETLGAVALKSIVSRYTLGGATTQYTVTMID